MMTKQEAAKLGGQTIALINRRKALENYYENPNVCQHCGITILVGIKQKVANTRRQKFCSRSCAAKFNNLGTDRWREKRRTLGKPEICQVRISKYMTGDPCGKCERCKADIQYISPPSTGGKRYRKKQYCDTCRLEVLAENGRAHMGNHLADLENMTRKQVRESTPTYQAHRTAIRKHAVRIYTTSGKPLICAVCGFPHHAQVCHKRAVSDFPDDALIKEINDINNLVALCPNHHWMLDNGLLKIDDLSSGSSVA